MHSDLGGLIEDLHTPLHSPDEAQPPPWLQQQQQQLATNPASDASSWYPASAKLTGSNVRKDCRYSTESETGLRHSFSAVGQGPSSWDPVPIKSEHPDPEAYTDNSGFGSHMSPMPGYSSHQQTRPFSFPRPRHFSQPRHNQVSSFSHASTSQGYLQSDLPNYPTTVLTSDDGSFCCPLCSNWFVTGPQLSEHIRAAHKKSVCVPCRRVFNSFASLCYHRNVKHGHNDQLKCEVCGKFFGHKQHMRTHMASVHKDYSFM